MSTADLSRRLERSRQQLARLADRARREADAALHELVEELQQAVEAVEAADRQLPGSRTQAEHYARRYQDLFDRASDAYVVTDERGVIRELNSQAERKLGRPARQLRDRPLVSLVAEGDRERFLDCLAAVGDEQGRTAERPLRFGSDPGFDASISAVLDPGEDGVEIRWTLRDVSELREREAFRDQIERSLESVVWLYQLDPRRALHVSEAYERVWGRPLSALEDDPRCWVEHVHPEDRARVEQALDELGQGRSYDIEFRIRRPDGEQRWIRDRGGPLKDSRGDLNRAAGLAEDVTERRRAERVVAAAVRQRRAAAVATERAEARERRTLARDLHDTVSQSLALARTKLVALRDETGEAARAALLRDVALLVGEADQQIRSLSFRLSPPVLHDLGLVAAAEWLADDLERRFGLRAFVADEGLREPLSEETREALFRSLRELLVNVARHADTEEARVTLARAGDEVTVRVEDAGSGFDAGRTPSGFGLVSIRERMEALGGRVEIDSEPGRGTRALLVVPAGAPA